MPRLWDLLPTLVGVKRDSLALTARMRLASIGKLKVFWDKDGELQIEAPLAPMESPSEIDRIMRQPPGAKG